MTATTTPEAARFRAEVEVPDPPPSPKGRSRYWDDTVTDAVAELRKRLREGGTRSDQALMMIIDLEKTRIRHSQCISGTFVPCLPDLDDDWGNPMPSGLPTVCHDQPPVCRDTERGASADLPPSDPRRHQVLVPHSTPAFLLKSASQGFSTLLSWPSTQRSWRHGRGDDIGTTTCGAGMKLTVAIDASSVFRMLVPAAADVPTSPPLQEQIGVGEGTLLVGQIYEPEEVSRNEAVEAGGRGDTIRTPAAGDRAKGGHTREGVLLIAMLGSTVAAARFLLSPLRRRCTGRSSRER